MKGGKSEKGATALQPIALLLFAILRSNSWKLYEPLKDLKIAKIILPSAVGQAPCNDRWSLEEKVEVS